MCLLLQLPFLARLLSLSLSYSLKHLFLAGLWKVTGCCSGCSIWCDHCIVFYASSLYILFSLGILISLSRTLSIYQPCLVHVCSAVLFFIFFYIFFFHHYGILYGSRANFPTCIVCMNAIFNVCLQCERSAIKINKKKKISLFSSSLSSSFWPLQNSQADKQQTGAALRANAQCGECVLFCFIFLLLLLEKCKETPMNDSWFLNL